MSSLPLSILDLSPVTTGISGPQALRNSIDLARLADRLGFARYWIAEHHNMPNIASSAPDIMIGQIAAVTERLRVGSGGVMLPNHAPLQVAERFQVLLLFEQRGFPESHPFRKVNAMPADVPLPPIFLLGSSGYSAQLAAHVGAGFSFAHHFSDFDPVGPMTTYREQYRPSEQRPEPHAILALHVVCADTDAEAERLATSVDLNFALRRQGRYQPIPSPEEAAAHSYSPSDRALIGQNRARLVVGDKSKVMAHLEPLIKATKADEVMITTMIYDHEARKHSYELMAEAFGLSPAR